MKRYIHSYTLLLTVAIWLLVSCSSHPDVPSSSKAAKCLPAIFPDYCNVTVPCNIAPLNFMLPAWHVSPRPTVSSRPMATA